MHNYQVTSFIPTLEKEVHISLPYIFTYNSDTLQIYDLKTLALLKVLDIAEIEMVEIIDKYAVKNLIICRNSGSISNNGLKNNVEDFSFYLLIYRKNEITIYHNNTVIRKKLIKNINRMVIAGQNIYLLSKTSLFRLDYNLEIQQKISLDSNLYIVSDRYICSKDGNLYDLSMKLIKSFNKRIKYVHDKNHVIFEDGSCSVSQHDVIKRKKKSINDKIIFFDTQHIITEHTINGSIVPYTIKHAYKHDNCLYLLTSDNEILVDGYVINSECHPAECFMLSDRIVFIKDFALRMVVNPLKVELMDTKKENHNNILHENGENLSCSVENTVEQTSFYKYAHLLLSSDILCMKSCILKAIGLNNRLFLADKYNIMVYDMSSVYMLVKDFGICYFDVDDNYLVFGTDDNEIYISKNYTEQISKHRRNADNRKMASTFFTSLQFFVACLEVKKLQVTQKCQINNLILHNEQIISLEKKKRIKIYTIDGDTVQDIKIIRNAWIHADKKNENVLLIVADKKIQIYGKDFVLTDEIEHINEFNACCIFNKVIFAVDYKACCFIYDIGAKKKKTINISRAITQEMENNNFESNYLPKHTNLHASSIKAYKDRFLVSGNFVILMEKYFIKDHEMVLNELKNNHFNINYILKYNICVNLFEYLLNNAQQNRNNDMSGKTISLLTTIDRTNRSKYINYLNKYINHSKYVDIIQALIHECLNSGMKLKCDFSKIDSWIKKVHREFIGMSLLFKRFK